MADHQTGTRNNPDIMLHDLSQSMTRHTKSLRHQDFDSILLAPTILPCSCLWLSLPDPAAGSQSDLSTHMNAHEERFLTSDELLVLQGWPCGKASPVDLSKQKESVKSSLAGNMFSSTPALAVFASLMTSLPWRSRDAEDEDVVADDAAGNAFDLLSTL